MEKILFWLKTGQNTKEELKSLIVFGDTLTTINLSNRQRFFKLPAGFGDAIQAHLLGFHGNVILGVITEPSGQIVDVEITRESFVEGGEPKQTLERLA